VQQRAEPLPPVRHSAQAGVAGARAKAEAFLNVAPLSGTTAGTVLAAGHAINAYRHLLTRVDKKQVDALVEANRESLAATPQPRRRKHAEQQEKAAAVAVAQAAVGAAPGRTSASTIS
jgi:hypothetical protein